MYTLGLVCFLFWYLKHFFLLHWFLNLEQNVTRRCLLRFGRYALTRRLLHYVGNRRAKAPLMRSAAGEALP